MCTPMSTMSHKIIASLAIWALSSFAILQYLRIFNFEYFFVLCLLGLLVIAYFFEPFAGERGLCTAINILIASGALIFSLIIVCKFLTIVGILPDISL